MKGWTGKEKIEQIRNQKKVSLSESLETRKVCGNGCVRRRQKGKGERKQTIAQIEA